MTCFKQIQLFILFSPLYNLFSFCDGVQDLRHIFPDSAVGEVGPRRDLIVKAYPALNNRTFANVLIPDLPVNSASECSIYCLQYFCHGFFFNQDNMECTLIHYWIFNEVVTVPKTGTKYFMAYHKDCPTDIGYHYFPAENFCVKIHTNTIAYFQIHFYCILERAAIVRVDTFKKMSILQSLIDSEGFNNDGDYFYIESKPFDGTFSFEDDTVIPYFDWLPGQPDGGARVVIGGNTQQYDDVYEGELFGYICERHIA